MVTGSYPVSHGNDPAYQGVARQPETSREALLRRRRLLALPPYRIARAGAALLPRIRGSQNQGDGLGPGFHRDQPQGLRAGTPAGGRRSPDRGLGHRPIPRGCLRARQARAGGRHDRARLDAHLTFISAELHKGFGPLFNPAIAAEARAAAVANLNRKLGLVETAFADGRAYLAGPDFSIADAYLFVVLSWAKHLGLDLAGLPGLVAFSARVLARDAVQAAMTAEGLLKAA